MPVLDLNAFDAMPLQHDPYDFLVVPAFIKPDALAAINHDFPLLQNAGNHAPQGLRYGSAFAMLLEEFSDPELVERFGAKFGVDLSSSSMTVTVRGHCERSDGNIHADHWSKIITALVYFNTAWDHEGGRLRILRSARDIEDYAVEIAPVNGTLVAFRRSDRSFHGHKRHQGERRIMQVSWNQPRRIARYVQSLNRLSTHTMKRVLRHLQPGG